MSNQKSLFRIVLEPLLVAVVLAIVVRAAVRIYAIPSPSMAPTLIAGDQILVTPYFGAHPARGDVVVFRAPWDENELMVKRVVALPGDLVDSRLGRVRIQGRTIAEPYVLRQASTGAIETQLVPQESYFLLGDNRDESFDSRSWGFVPRSHIVGRARLVLWSSSDGAASSGVAQAAPLGGETRPEGKATGSRIFKCVK